MLHLRVIFAIALAVFAARPAPAGATAPLSMARLRPQSPRVAAWLARGRQRSPTLRALADQVERGDVVVYLEIAFRLDPRLAACVTWMASVPGARYVRVSLRPEVQSADDLAALHARIGHRTGAGRTWDTVAALRVGDLARTELVRGT